SVGQGTVSAAKYLFGFVGGTLTVSQAATSTSLSLSVGSPVFGQPVILSATVAVLPPGGGTATGLVLFEDGGTVVGSSPLDSSGKATFTTSTLAVGPHNSLTAVYQGDK